MEATVCSRKLFPDWPLGLSAPVKGLSLLPPASTDYSSAAALLSLLPPERQNSSLSCYKHLNRQVPRLSAPCENSHSPVTTPNTYTHRAVTLPHAAQQQTVLSPESDLRDKQLAQSYKQQHHLHHYKKYTFRQKMRNLLVMQCEVKMKWVSLICCKMAAKRIW